MARLAAHPQKAMLQPAIFQKLFEFPLHIARQFPALLRHQRCGRRVILSDDLIEQGLLWAMALITARIPIPAGHPGRHMGHDPRLYDTVYLYILSPGCEIMKPQPQCLPVPATTCECQSPPLYYQ